MIQIATAACPFESSMESSLPPPTAEEQEPYKASETSPDLSWNHN
jgi:hypothetical protein